LGDILHFSGISDQSRQKTGELALIFRDEQAKSLLVAALDTLDQLLVNFAIAHGRERYTLCVVGRLATDRTVYPSDRKSLPKHCG
jgi:hypothetical protein